MAIEPKPTGEIILPEETTHAKTDEFEDGVERIKQDLESRADGDATDIFQPVIDGEKSGDFEEPVAHRKPLYLDAFTLRTSPFMTLEGLADHINNNLYTIQLGKPGDIKNIALSHHLAKAKMYPLALYEDKLLLAVKSYDEQGNLRDPEEIERAARADIQTQFTDVGNFQLLLLKNDETKNNDEFRRVLDLAKNPMKRQKYMSGLDTETSAGNALYVIVSDAIKHGASDIHINPQDSREIKVKYRVDGILREIPKSIPAALLKRAIGVIMVKSAGMNSEEDPRVPQDGTIQPGDKIEFIEKDSSQEVRSRETLPENYTFRTSVMPTINGRKVTIRIHNSQSKLKSLDELGFNKRIVSGIEGLLQEDKGVILVTGPTGSGKTTSLYAMLQKLNTGQYNILTVEDPVEMILPGVNQSQVSPKFGFADSLRAYLRHDPDIILIGEIRDLETADLVLRASNTGHLVLSTLHTNDAVSSITRLMDLGVSGALAANSVKGILAQRLVGQLCPNCKEQYDAKEELSSLVQSPGLITRSLEVYKPKVGSDCGHCKGMGYKGRLPLVELWIPESESRIKMIEGCKNYETYFDLACKNGMEPMLYSGLDLVLEGKTSLKELFEHISLGEAIERRELIKRRIEGE